MEIKFFNKLRHVFFADFCDGIYCLENNLFSAEICLINIRYFLSKIRKMKTMNWMFSIFDPILAWFLKLCQDLLLRIFQC